MSKIILISLFFVLSLKNDTLPVQPADFAIYTDDGSGVWKDGIIAFEQFLKWKGLSYNRITALDVNGVDLKNYYKAIYFPGGDADYYNADINENGIKNIQELVSFGGGYIGMCAGAEFACDTFIWEGISYDYPLDLFKGTAIGPIDEIAPWPNYTMTTLNMNQENPINIFEPETERILYYGGSAFYPETNMTIDTVASWEAYENRNAIINFYFDAGRILLVGPHPEIEEDSDRDSTDVAEELNDEGSDWNFLWSAVDWLLKVPVTQPPFSSAHQVVETFTEFSYLRNYPNPFNMNTKIEYHVAKPAQVNLFIYNTLGQKVRTLINLKQEAGKYSVSFDGRGFVSGVYFYKLSINEIAQIRKMILMR